MHHVPIIYIIKTVMKRYFYLCCLFLILCSPLIAQTAERLERLLNNEALSYGELALFLFEAANVAERYGPEVISSPEAAFNFAVERNWLSANLAIEDTAVLNRASLLIMRAFQLRGGIFYSIFRSPHYAFRELVHQGMIQGRVSPRMPVSGEMMMFVVGRVLSSIEEDILPPPPPPIENGQDVLLEDVLVEDINAQFEALGLTGVSARLTDEGITIGLTNLQFVANTAELMDMEELWEVVRVLQTVPARRMLITGHTADAGTPQTQMQISLERARTVAEFLIQAQIWDEDAISYRGYGAQRPIADNTTPEGMAQNRRVDIVIVETL